ncbi:phosphoglycerate mutase [Bacillus clarus]|uniref:Phosphoglycerate mutase n=1 Tax=Bacillus clarus TaxID=2338372 RepID=A0A090YM90_9BACI|nr:hypothetical protein [Bacillus clarus]KFM99356.1 putative membrane protein [Bacillus clarus]RFT64447.1 phosphoglycerate mutase [Bacillus clarus]
MKWLIALIWMILCGYINGFFGSDKTTANPWIKDDERENGIKHKAIIASWSGVFMFCIISLCNKLLGLGEGKSPYLPDPFAIISKENVELQVLLMLFIMHGIFYLYYQRKLSA